MNLTITEIQFEEYADRILELRSIAWNTPSKKEWIPRVFPEGFQDSYDASGHHWIVKTKDDLLVASARLTIHNRPHELPDKHLWGTALTDALCYPLGVMGRLVVHPGFLRLGIGGSLDKIREEKGREMNCKMLAGITYEERAKQLANRGFELSSLPGRDFLCLQILEN